MAGRTTIVELTDDHVDDAAELLAERHRATNLASSRTWPRLGFRPTLHRLFRGIT